MTSNPAHNALGDETSPYLLQHRDNPVHWQAWSEATLAAAKAADKPILLSIGYAACHWCHVMAAESFANPAIAAAMNRHFINIKVDREERPDIDAIYMHALHMMGEQGGWPLTMFLTPEGEPFWGGTYFPPAPRYGRPGFPQVLEAIAEAYRKDRATITKNVAALRQGLAQLAAPQGGQAIDLAMIDQVAARVAQEVDGVHGGIGSAPKFPQGPVLELLWRAGTRGNAAAHDAVLLTLDHIAQGGIYDHVGGGFARYSVDARWLVPHFEKMLYDNALLLERYTAAWQATRKPLYAERVAETIAWLAREMRLASGGFASSLDADSEHVEGKFYVWSEAEIEAVLGPRAARFKEFYDVSAAGNWEEHNILNRLDRPDRAGDDIERELAADRATLLAARAPRIRPGIDDKVLADWNGLTIAALVEAACVFGRADWLDLGRNAFDFVVAAMSDSAGRLYHSWRGRAQHRAILDDYANMSRAGLALYEATGDARYLMRVQNWIALVSKHYADPRGGFFFTADDAESLIARSKNALDQPNPSGNGTIAAVLARLYYLTGDADYRRAAQATLDAFAGGARQNLFGHATLLNAAELLLKGLQVAIVGGRNDAGTQALLAAIYRQNLPNRIVSVIAPGAALPPGHPAAGKERISGKATAYVCDGPVCSLPLTDAAALAEHLAQRG
ncbi:MAG TPA: thioredoxin domain-containing protein [Stellaceae bacterium]|nr:thioredoxin domain-containing protein [Stellaceae bacterium]